ncbi:PAS domain-containing protein [Streptomyces flaveolus]|uniref:PAS domain-containing protein n=1 Tax=Streptomyces flaveolus TaxID=67297 RepID=UPI00357171B3
MVRTYPRTSVVLPYPLVLAAAPVTGTRRWGALLLMWPATRPPYMTGRERGHNTASCRRLARLLEEAAERGRLPSGDELLRVVPLAPEDRSDSRAMAAADFAERLPGGSCALNLEGQVTYVSTGACDLLDCEAGRLLGTVPWQSLRWLDDPTYEDRYRAAVLSREPVSFTACRPPAHWLEFHLYPDASGISIRIVPSGAQPPPEPASSHSARPATPARAGRLYQLTHLAAGLTEVVGVQDVVALVAEQVMPAFGARGLPVHSGGRPAADHRIPRLRPPDHRAPRRSVRRYRLHPGRARPQQRSPRVLPILRRCAGCTPRPLRSAENRHGPSFP